MVTRLGQDVFIGCFFFFFFFVALRKKQRGLGKEISESLFHRVQKNRRARKQFPTDC